MINPLTIEPTEDTPRIELNAAKNLFEISLRSLPEDPTGFYSPVVAWLSNYSQSPNSTTPFSFKLEYFNTASAKQLLKILFMLQDLSSKSEVTVDWHYEQGDKDMQSSGERYSKLVNLKFNMIGY